ncbi:hypothetical protein HYX02_00545 [Candidatus Woesearchaeota archaeon]|nr:hypothetical protein [Candidatus Woesearchaeota archaeon]
MRVVLSQKHLSLNKKLVKEVNLIFRSFNGKSYSKIENIEQILFRYDVPVEKKKELLIKKLHESIAKTFSINKKKLNKSIFKALMRRIQSIRKIVDKLRSINHYLETTFLQDLKPSKIPTTSNQKIKQQSAIARDELEALEYTAYKLIGEAAMLDKKLLKEYKQKGEVVFKKEKTGLKDLNIILRKESELLMHLEAKLPPANAFTSKLIKEPNFSHWVARIFALLSYFEHVYNQEKAIFGKLKKNKNMRRMIAKKIKHLTKETSELIKIMEEKSFSMEKPGISRDFKEELRKFTTIINL